jgi:hypothetical protein
MTKLNNILLLLCGIAGLVLIMVFVVASRSPAQTTSGPTLQIVSPVNGTVVNPGQTVNVVVEPSPGTTFELVIAGIAELPRVRDLKDSPPYEFTLTIPLDATPGEYQIGASGVISEGTGVNATPVVIRVEKLEGLLKLDVQPAFVFLRFVGEQKRLDVNGTYSDGKTLGLTFSAGTTYSSDDPTIASVDSRGVITGIKAGATTVHVRNGGQSFDVRVSVPPTIPGDLDGNGRVDQDDANRLADVFLVAPVMPANQPFDPMDLNGDGVIDTNDAQQLIALCSGTCTMPVSASAVPGEIAAQGIQATLAGSSLLVTDTVSNSGKTPLDNVGVNFYLSPNPTITDASPNILIGSRVISHIDPGATDTGSTTISLHDIPTGNYYVGVFYDPNHLIAESNENDNTKATSGTLLIGPDLQTYGIQGSLAGTSIIISDTQINTGSEPAPPYAVSFYFTTNTANPQSGSLIGSRSLSSGLAGGSTTDSASTTFAVPSIQTGSYYLCAVSDTGSPPVVETNETNNIKCTTGKFTIGPDLRILTLSGTLSGTSIVISDTEQNIGNLAAGPFDASFYFTTNTANPTNGTLIGSRSLSGLAGGSATNSGSTTFAVPSSTPKGSYYVCGISDSGGAISEINETNNIRCTSGQFAIGPDLRVFSLSVTKAGGNFFISDTEQNIGNVAAGSFDVSFYLSSNTTFDGSDILLGSRSIAGLAGGSATNTGSSTFPVPSDHSGSFYIIAVSDSGLAVTEINEGNNTKATSGKYAVP